MQFTDALKTVQAFSSSNLPPFRVLLACGFTPLHLQTFLTAHLQERMAQRRVSVMPGLYGDGIGSLDRAAAGDFHGCAFVLEWPDLDPRLGFRTLGGWSPEKIPDIVAHVRAQIARTKEALERIPVHVPVAVSPPSLPLAPVFFHAGWEAGSAETELHREIADLAAWCAPRRNLHVASSQWVDRFSPAPRFDLKTELLAGISYTPAHAELIARSLSYLLHPRPPMKGLITDLDGTLWKGILGDVGVDGVFWDLANHAQLHGLYQQLLASFAAEGVLVGVASRNNPALVEEAFGRRDMLLLKDTVFPFEVHWNIKSDSVTRILKAWNVAADSVVFVDDSPMELAEVKAVHADMECVRFPDDYGGGLDLLYRLRDLFGKSALTHEDSLRRESLRAAQVFQPAREGVATSEDLLRQAEAKLTLNFRSAASDPRCFELVNKTNQFNLNGRRVSEAEWHDATVRPGRFAVSAAYQDKFGSLGTIAVISGEKRADSLMVDIWVMSCRAFARRIEHQCMAMLFEFFRSRTMTFDFVPTPRNEPLQEFFASLLGGKPTAPFSLPCSDFARTCPPLYHAVECIHG